MELRCSRPGGCGGVLGLVELTRRETERNIRFVGGHELGTIAKKGVKDGK